MNSHDHLGAMQSVTLPELDAAQLHDREESKVILHRNDVVSALRNLSTDYFILEHEGKRMQRYRNDYFDSVDLTNYHQHHNQKGQRHKLRYRTYVNSNITYFEVKQNVHGRTVKVRRRSQLPEQRLLPRDAVFFFKQTGLAPSHLIPSLRVDYERILLVKQDFSERVTIDVDLSFSSARGEVQIPELAICEFKQPQFDRSSPAMVAMNRRPQNFSKYCMGLASCDPSLRRNRFKKVFRNLESLDAMPTSRGLVAA